MMFPRDAVKSMTLGAAVALGALNLASGSALAAPVFINEIHYDNAGADTGEAIEIAGPAGTDLSGWSLSLYNGNGGAAYNTFALSGVIPDQSAGYGAVNFALPTLQNGAPDGIALANSGTVVQFLSYEGSFTAVGGIANGMTSVDIGVQETSGTPVGDSLQLIGPGQSSADFTWHKPAPNTFGAINTDQTFLASLPTPTELFFSEYVEGSSFVKALEMANFTGADIDLGAGDYEILIYSNGSLTPNFTIDLTGNVGDGDVFVIAHSNAGSAVLAAADAIFNNILFNGDDAVALTMGGVLIDVIGEVGFDPGGQWGSGLVSTANNTLRRKDLVFGGDLDGSDLFNPFVEWLGYPQDTIDGLGFHAIRTEQVPEPATLALFSFGLAGLGFMRRRRFNA
jgi:hypothetical protein